jgi:L-alanine-DL-glutamate epimerase-like enolase superfamily enzyme
MKIESIELHLSRIPLPQGPWGDQIHKVTHIEILLADITTDTGLTGTGFSHTSGVGGITMKAMLEELIPELIGKEVNPRALWHSSWQYLRDNGVGGTTTLALAAIDTAVWDLIGKQYKLPLPKLLGQMRDSVPLYGSGINLNLSAEEVVEQVKAWKADGYFAAKVKVGKPDIEEDFERLAKIREAVGMFPLMVDANQGWTYAEGVRATERFRSLGLYWVEEPYRVDDVLAYSRLRARASMPIALGENLYTLQQFNQFLTADACDYVQADVCRVGGITPYLEIAAQGRAFDAPMAPHFVVELSATLLCAIPNALCGEKTDGGTLTELGVIEPQPPQHGRFVPKDTPGHGLVFNRHWLKQNEVQHG